MGSPDERALDVVAELFTEGAAAVTVAHMCDVVGDLEQHGHGDEQFTAGADNVGDFFADARES